MLVGECLQLAIGPSVENPVPYANPGLLSIVLALIPVGLDLIEEAVLGGLGRNGGL